MTDPTEPVTEGEGHPLLNVDQELAADQILLDRDVELTIAELTAPTPEDDAAPALDMDALERLKKLKRAKQRYEAMVRALGPAIAELEGEIVDQVIPHRGPDGRWATTVGDATGYLATTLWPRRNVDEDTGQKYGTEDLIKALRTDDIKFLIAEQVNGQTLAAWMREQVDAWTERCGEDGVRNARGELVDAYGNALTADEALDPTAPELAMPPHVRRILSVTVDMKIKFRAT